MKESENEFAVNKMNMVTAIDLGTHTMKIIYPNNVVSRAQAEKTEDKNECRRIAQRSETGVDVTCSGRRWAYEPGCQGNQPQQNKR